RARAALGRRGPAPVLIVNVAAARRGERLSLRLIAGRRRTAEQQFEFAGGRVRNENGRTFHRSYQATRPGDPGPRLKSLTNPGETSLAITGGQPAVRQRGLGSSWQAM